MKIPRDVSGAHLADILCRRWQYTRVHQAGSHIILETSKPNYHRMAIPDHHPLRLGTFSAILRAVAGHKGVPREAIIADLWAAAIVKWIAESRHGAVEPRSRPEAGSVFTVSLPR